MKRSIISQFDQYKERLGGYVGMMSFRYMNLCVKAEEASLIPVEVPIEDELKEIEEGHQRYLQGKAEQQKLLQEQKESNDDTLMHSIKLNQEE